MKRNGAAFPSIALDRKSRQPMHRQISQQIANSIHAGEVEKGARLPSTRLLAKLLDVSRNTVLTAYEELVAADLITGAPGAGMRVNAGPPTGMFAIGLRHVIRNAHFPSKTIPFCDPDGNPLYFSY